MPSSSVSTSIAAKPVRRWNNGSPIGWPVAGLARSTEGRLGAVSEVIVGLPDHEDARRAAGRGAGRGRGAAVAGSAPSSSMRRRQDRLALRVGQVFLPRGLDQLGHWLGQRDIVELSGHVTALLVGPLEEADHLLGGLGLLLLLVHQDEG